MFFPLGRRCGSMDSPHLTTMGHKVGEGDAGQCAQRMSSAAGQHSARKYMRGA